MSWVGGFETLRGRASAIEFNLKLVLARVNVLDEEVDRHKNEINKLNRLRGY